MEITEVRIKLMEDNSGSNERLQAFCSITFDDMFVIRDLKIIEGAKGFFVAMPSRKLTDRCNHCGTKNHLRSRFCNQCGGRLDENRALRDADGRAKLHADIAHPINSACREKIQAAVLASYADELERSKLPGYVSRYDDIDGGEEFEVNPYETPMPARRMPRPASPRCGAAVRSAATPSTTAARSCGALTSPRARTRPKGSAPTARTVSAPDFDPSRHRSWLDQPRHDAALFAASWRFSDAREIRSTAVRDLLPHPASVLFPERPDRRIPIIQRTSIPPALECRGEDGAVVDPDTGIGRPQWDRQCGQRVTNRPGIHVAIRPTVGSGDKAVIIAGW